MTENEFNAFCACLPKTAYVMQWGGSHVWKVGDKVFAIGRPDADILGITFKVTPLSYDILKNEPGFRPAPYLASRGMKWIQRHASSDISDAHLKAYIERSYDLVVEKLTRRSRAALGLQAKAPGERS
ncbi:MAG: MmcQ/YjbR family DNA-binding protein [Rhizobiales bacterium]|nr:MmcQ/YjbR family DNA-binding protein [Hyphomicrobiales bacterium]